MSVLVNESDQPVSGRAQLVDYFARAGRPKGEWLIGCEHEKFPFRLSTLSPVSYEEKNGLRDFLQGMREFGWAPVMEGDTIIGLSRGKAAISFEPGGQVELSGAPFRDLHAVAAETDQHLVEASEIGERLGIGFLGMGFHPTAARDAVPWVPKQRYRIMREYMSKVGRFGHDMMLRTCTVQVNLDFGDEADMIKKMRVGLALQPVATALFASSPFTEGRPNGLNSARMNCWLDLDPDRTGALPFVFEDGFGYERYTDYALDVPMYFVWRDGKYIDCAGQSFRDFLAGKLPALPGKLPTITDWANHLTTLFPDVRLKKIIEMRGADAGMPEMMQALPAFWVGLLYDPASLDAAWDLAKNFTPEERAQFHGRVPKDGLRTVAGNRKLIDVACAAVEIAREGLRRRAVYAGGIDESSYLDPLLAIAESGQNDADRLLKEAKTRPDFVAKDIFALRRLSAPLRTPEYIATAKTSG
ncbi:MAG: glutamate--cysteine ligase [Bdellovibrionales bacterium]